MTTHTDNRFSGLLESYMTLVGAVLRAVSIDVGRLRRGTHSFLEGWTTHFIFSLFRLFSVVVWSCDISRDVLSFEVN